MDRKEGWEGGKEEERKRIKGEKRKAQQEGSLLEGWDGEHCGTGSKNRQNEKQLRDCCGECVQREREGKKREDTDIEKSNELHFFSFL